MAVEKSQKRPGLVIYSCLTDSAFRAVRGDDIICPEKGTLSVKNGTYKTVRGWTSGQSFPV